MPKLLLLVALVAIMLVACDGQDATQSAVEETATVSASDSGDSPDVAQAAVNETCDALTNLQQEWRLGRVDETRYLGAYRDILSSLNAAGDRVGRPLGDAVAETCPTAWHDAIATSDAIRQRSRAVLGSFHCYELERIQQLGNRERFAQEYDDFLSSDTYPELAAEHCPDVWEEAAARRARAR
ncbi:MAG: hypothetical protein F4Y02_17610 [Chloroflexi bacterium]|nr:hypothetical protein [Chloroflexota bacterium]